MWTDLGTAESTVGPAPLVHLVSTWRHSRDECSEVFLFLPLFWFCELLSTQTEEWKMAKEQSYSDTVYSRTISYQWMLHYIQYSPSPHISHTHPMQHAKHERDSHVGRALCAGVHVGMWEKQVYTIGMLRKPIKEKSAHSSTRKVSHISHCFVGLWYRKQVQIDGT